MEPTQEDSGSPILSQKYDCLSDMVDELIKLGPSESTYSLLFDLVGREKEDVIREKLSSFFQGSATASGSIYSILIEAGKANPIDSEIVGGLMDSHPELFNKNKEDNNQHASSSKNVKYAGLFIPDSYCGTKTNSEKMVKTADSAAFPHYPIGDNLRMCPKIRDVVSTDICRFHCLDGIVVANAEPICGEELWRNNVMDKYSTEHLDKDGKWVGGYLEKRFKTFHDDGGHSMMIKPGNRSNPIHEDAWSTEKRLVELRKSEGKKREYNGVYEPKDLYNFDQHEKGEPKNPQLFAKKPDPVSRTASFNLKQTRLAQNESAATQDAPGRDLGSNSSKTCLDCEATCSDKAIKCQNCGSQNLSCNTKLEDINRARAVIPQKAASTNLIIKNDLGVFSASKNGITSYASTKEDAIIKLADSLAGLENQGAGTVGENNSDLLADFSNDMPSNMHPSESKSIEIGNPIVEDFDLRAEELPENVSDTNLIQNKSIGENGETISDEISRDNNETRYIKETLPLESDDEYIPDTGIDDDSDYESNNPNATHITSDRLNEFIEQNPGHDEFTKKII